jgi:hypothetical protein
MREITRNDVVESLYVPSVAIGEEQVARMPTRPRSRRLRATSTAATAVRLFESYRDAEEPRPMKKITALNTNGVRAKSVEFRE